MKDKEHYFPEVQFIIMYSSFPIIHTFLRQSKEKDKENLKDITGRRKSTSVRHAPRYTHTHRQRTQS